MVRIHSVNCQFQIALESYNYSCTELNAGYGTARRGVCLRLPQRSG